MNDVQEILNDVSQPSDGLEQSRLALEPELELTVIRKDGEIEDKGVVSRKAVTNAFVNYLVQSMLSTSTAMAVFKYHIGGSGTATENATDTDLGTAVGNRSTAATNSTGTAANIFQSIATISYTATAAITEHGVFSDTSGGTLLDRSSFAAVNVVSGDSIAFTYKLTCSAGG